MFRHGIILLLLFGCHAYGQEYKINKPLLLLMDSAEKAFCNNDTATTITLLETIAQQYPTDVIVALNNKAPGHLYLAKGQQQAAKRA